VTAIKTAFDPLVKAVRKGDMTFEGPGWLVVVPRSGVILYAEKPNGTAEKAVRRSMPLLRFGPPGVASINLEEDNGDPPCPTCGEFVRSAPKLEKHVRLHRRHGIGAVAREQRRRLARSIP
jgi:hypothetical protein